MAPDTDTGLPLGPTTVTSQAHRNEGERRLAVVVARGHDVAAASLKLARVRAARDHKLVLTKKPAGADITLGAGPGGAIAGQIVEVPRDISLTHPYTTKPAVEAIQKKLGTSTRFTSHDFPAVPLPSTKGTRVPKIEAAIKDTIGRFRRRRHTRTRTPGPGAPKSRPAKIAPRR